MANLNTHPGHLSDEGERWDQQRPEEYEQAHSDRSLENEESATARFYDHMEEFHIEDGADQLPRFLKPSSSGSSFKRFPETLLRWTKGPEPPRMQSIKPILPSIQEAPVRFVNAICPTRAAKVTLLSLCIISWLVPFIYLVRTSLDPGQLRDADIIRLGCLDTFWYKRNECGLDGISCHPFNGSEFPFRCPANCASVHLLNPRSVGAQQIDYRSLIVGGPRYRGDSWICPAAIHAGTLSDAEGGCGMVSLVGEANAYNSTTMHGLTSIGFDSSFPSSFRIEAAECKAKDLRWTILLLTVVFTLLISLFATSSAASFPTLFTSIFFHVGLVSDPPFNSKLSSLFSNILGKFLPASLYACFIYLFFLRLSGKAQIEKTIFWLGGCWVGALTNYTFDWIPIQRLTPHDIDQQPGAKLALAVIVLVLCGIVLQQIYNLRLEGRLQRYLGIYGLLALSLLTSLLIPGMRLRIHHYVLALLLIPGTSIQTRPSLFYQGLLIGLFINGIARWGFDSVLQTDAGLRGDGHYNSILPNVTQPIISLGTPQTISFDYTFPPPQQKIAEDVDGAVDGISILVNDVERHRRYIDELGEEHKFTWKRNIDEPHYFRFGYMQGRRSFDYTQAGIWDREGNWIVMKPGPGGKS